jgi:hypothetical protein
MTIIWDTTLTENLKKENTEKGALPWQKRMFHHFFPLHRSMQKN